MCFIKKPKSYQEQLEYNVQRGNKLLVKIVSAQRFGVSVPTSAIKKLEKILDDNARINEQTGYRYVDTLMVPLGRGKTVTLGAWYASVNLVLHSFNHGL